MHDKSNPPEFMKTVDEIRTAEAQYDHIISSAREKADFIIRKAKETVMEERRKREESLVSYKTTRLQAGAKEIDASIEKTIVSAKESAAKTSKKRLVQSVLIQLAKDFISSILS